MVLNCDPLNCFLFDMNLRCRPSFTSICIFFICPSRNPFYSLLMETPHKITQMHKIPNSTKSTPARAHKEIPPHAGRRCCTRLAMPPDSTTYSLQHLHVHVVEHTWALGQENHRTTAAAWDLWRHLAQPLPKAGPITAGCSGSCLVEL